MLVREPGLGRPLMPDTRHHHHHAYARPGAGRRHPDFHHRIAAGTNRP